MGFEIWHAALVVLHERGRGAHYKEIADEILTRKLYESEAKQFFQSVGYAMRTQGEECFAGSDGIYWLKDPERCKGIYLRLKSEFPWKPFDTDATSALMSAPPSQAADSRGDQHRLALEGLAENRNRSARTMHGPGGSAMKRPAKKPHDVSNLQVPIIAEEVPESYEGEKRRITINSYERDPAARAICIAAHGFRCAVCNMSFSEEYGEIGESYIHVHHKHPIGEGARRTDPIKDLVPLCANCHAMVHRETPSLGYEELKKRRAKAKRRRSNRRKTRRQTTTRK